MFRFIYFTLLAVLIVINISCSDQSSNLVDPLSNESLTKSAQILTPGDLSEAEEASLIFMRQEEKLLRDVYTVFVQTWEIKIFDQLKMAEQKHMDAIERLLNKYSITDPVTSDEIGVFDDPQFQQKFNDYTAQGIITIPDAMLAGQTMEQEDIDAITNYLLEVDNSDIIKVYTHLKSSSEAHLTSIGSHAISLQ